MIRHTRMQGAGSLLFVLVVGTGQGGAWAATPLNSVSVSPDVTVELSSALFDDEHATREQYP